ncbi:hypothetical protein KKG83_05985 [Candidatus Micrarchaeota archaeon]|nr:hypothetical protein [Candidatus Micrarchaeota archaeon]MBU2476993.1 hypothetical protein [Candidatus Micrarchaeota archaeon]
MTRARSRKVRDVTALRRRITAGFKIRGTAREFSVSTNSSIAREKLPAYFVHPLYRMHSKQWVSRLHATVHAAVARALQHGKTLWGVSGKGWNPKNVSSKDLPLLVVFSTSQFTTEKSGVKAFLAERGMQLSSASKDKFKSPFEHRRKRYELGVVHGRKKPSFIESHVDGSIKRGRLYPDDKKLFQVGMTKKEYERVIARINRKLKRIGFSSIEEFEESYRKAFRKAKEKGEEQWKKVNQEFYDNALKALKQTKLDFPPEVSHFTPSSYLFYSEACRLLTNKLVRRANKWIERNIPEK